MELQTQTIFYVNIGILILIVFFMFNGYRKGFLLKLVSILSFIVVGMLAWWLSSPLSRLLMLYPHDSTPMKDTMLEGLFYENLNRIFVFVILFVLLMLAVIVIKPLFKLLSSIPVVSFVNKIAGCLLGGVQAILLLLLATMILRLPFWEEGSRIASLSLLRFSDPIMTELLFYAKQPLSELQKLKDALEQKDTFSQKEIENLQLWLSQQNVDKEKADELLQSLRSE